jgi:hypothetical protein
LVLSVVPVYLTGASYCSRIEGNPNDPFEIDLFFYIVVPPSTALERQLNLLRRLVSVEVMACRVDGIQEEGRQVDPKLVKNPMDLPYCM